MSRNKQNKDLFPPSEISWAAIAFERESDPFVYRFIIYFLSGLLVTGFAFSAVVKIPISVTGEGKITSFNPPVPIRASSKMTVSKLAVTENQKVKKGQLLVQSQEDLSKEDLALLRQILADLQKVTSVDLYKCTNCVDHLRKAATEYLRLQAQGDLISVITPLSDATKEMIVALEDLRQLPSRIEDAKLQIRIDEKKLAAISAKGAESILAKEVESLTTEIAFEKTRINEKKEVVRQRISAASIALESRMSELRNRTTYLGQQYAVYAPFNGTVVSLNVKGAGELLQVGQELMSLIPENSPLIVELKVENKDLTDIAKNAFTTVTIDALPEYDYGYATGHVSDVVRKEADANRVAQNERTLASADTPVFLARVALDQQSLVKNGVPAPFIIGMTVKGQINVRTESILHVVIRSLFQTKDDMQTSER